MSRRQGVIAYPSRQPRRIVTRPVVIQAALFVAFLTDEAIALLGKTAEARLSIGRIFLAADQSARVVNDDVAAAQMVTEVKFHSRGCVIREWQTGPDKGDPSLVVHYVQRIVLLRRVVPYDSLTLEDAVNVNGNLYLPTLLARQLLHAHAGRVVKILGMYGRLSVAGLRAIDSHPVAVVPLEVS